MLSYQEEGPFNFPDFIEGGTTNGGNPPDPDPPGTKTEADLSDDPVIGDPGGGGGPFPSLAWGRRA